ncbi:RNA methyltransferase [Psychromonas sp. Urea-02u-13]|uniref:RNA methyltransferase n=1 Tax=Psychromonas sp. Urea-02u-13 TaxID=2058326 RepID=UPI000C344CC8|nr:RNA methyltransferase [Psychromonas sp. Urea-02u-13]PKG40278.1 23S rRNA methyltransferase [Psychromonas sp. Urea-02u-13]
MSENSVSIGLSNPKSPTNVGAVMRAAGCYGVDNVIYTGTRYDRAVKLNTDTKQALSKIPLKQQAHLLDDKAHDVKVICVDLVEGAIPLPNFQHPEKAIYLFGPEDGTLSQQLINQADAVVYIPTTGCMNLAATVNVLLYDRLAKSDKFVTDNDLIKQSRDNNNRVKVKNNASS